MVRSTKRRWLAWWSRSTRCLAPRAMIGLPSTRRFVSSSKTETTWQHKDIDHQQLVTMQQCSSLLEVIDYIIELYFPRQLHTQQDSSNTWTLMATVNWTKKNSSRCHYLGSMFYSKFLSKTNHFLHQGCQKDSELMEKLEAIVSQCMINTATWFGPCSFDLSKYHYRFSDIYLMQLKNLKLLHDL